MKGVLHCHMSSTSDNLSGQRIFCNQKFVSAPSIHRVLVAVYPANELCWQMFNKQKRLCFYIIEMYKSFFQPGK